MRDGGEPGVGGWVEAAGAPGSGGLPSLSAASPRATPCRQALGAAWSRSGEGHETMSVAKGRMCAEPGEARIGWR